MTKWENLGDINFLSYGGCLVKPHFSEKELSELENGGENLKLIFDVFYLNPEYGEKDDLKNYAALCCIDLTDSWIDYDGMLQFIGEDHRIGSSLEDLLKELSPQLLAKEIVEYEGVVNCNPIVVKNGRLIQYPISWTDFIISNEDLINWLKDIGAEEFI